MVGRVQLRYRQKRAEKVPHNLGLYLCQDENPLAENNTLGNDRPEPGQTTSGENEFFRLPYLGNWEQRRRNGFYAFEDLTKAKAVQQALKHRHELHEATRALAPLIAKRMAFWYQVRDQITEGYAGKIFEDNKSVTDAQQKKRVDVFLEWQRGVEDIILR